MKVKRLRVLPLAGLITIIAIAGVLSLFYSTGGVMSEENNTGEAGCVVAGEVFLCALAAGMGDEVGQQEVTAVNDTNTGAPSPNAGIASKTGLEQNEPRRLPLLDVNAPSTTKTATFGMGCFWGAEALFGSVDGVVRTRVGYAGGTMENPTYYNIGDHTETVQLDYDPGTISYEELLELFWANHDPFNEPWKRQYISLILFHDEQQREVAEKSREEYTAKHGNVYTEISELDKFYWAEGYHQKYYLQQRGSFVEELRRLYPQTEDFVNSTVAARLNGYVARHGSCDGLKKQLPCLGLSEQVARSLSIMVCGEAVEELEQDVSPAGVSCLECDKIVKSEEEWREILTPEQFHVLREKGTESAFTGEYVNNHEDGIYRCAGCGQPLFSSSAKFDSGTGWPSFSSPISAACIEEKSDYSLALLPRTEVLCNRCGGHLGHVFNDGPEPTLKRYCINSLSLTFEQGEEESGL